MSLISKPTLVLAAVLALGGCGKTQEQPAAPPPTTVVAMTVSAEPLPNIFELPGRIEAVRSAEVRARTAGIVLRRLYTEGTDVQAGAPLFEIDPRESRAQVQQSRATLERAQAAEANAGSIARRYEGLVADRSISAQEYDSAVSDLRQARAQVAEARATLAQAELQLSYTVIRAPIAGRVGRAEVTEGALVSGGEGTLMTRIDQMSPVHAVFAQSNVAALDMIARIRAGGLQPGSNAQSSVTLTLANGAQYSQTGRLDFTDQFVEPSTGSQTVRAIFGNPDRLLRPGQFVRGRVQVGVIPAGIAVPQRAVQFRGSQASVTLVGPDGAAVARPVTLGAQIGDRWAVESGLKVGDRVIVEGWQKVRPGGKVQIQGAVPPAAARPAAAASSAGR